MSSSLRAAFAPLLLALGCALGQPAFAQSTTPPGGPLTPPDALPDLVVTSVKGSAVCTPQGTITATIVAVVKNTGPKATVDLTNVAWQIILSAQWWPQAGNQYLEKNPPPQTVQPFVGGPKKLAPGQTWTGTMTIAGITKYKYPKNITVAGNYVLQARADPNKNVPESNEKNNDTRTTVADPCFKK